MNSAAPSRVPAGGPFFEDLAVGMITADAPALTLTAGHAAVHQAIVGDRLPLHLDTTIGARVVPGDGQLAHPALVWDVAIGQSTFLTQRVIANLFYRGLLFRRLPRIGDTLRTTTEVVGLRQNAPRADRATTGFAALRVRTVDQHDRSVLDFWRCAMLPLRDPDRRTCHHADFAAIPTALPEDALVELVSGWHLRELAPPGQAPPGGRGRRCEVEGGDVVSAAPELVRLTLNLARAHHDARASGNRLVYGGHTIGLAATQAARAVPELLTIIAWHGCEHLAPVFEGDTLTSVVELERTTILPAGGRLLHLRSRVTAHRRGGSAPSSTGASSARRRDGGVGLGPPSRRTDRVVPVDCVTDRSPFRYRQRGLLALRSHRAWRRGNAVRCPPRFQQRRER